MFCSEHEPLALLLELTPKLAKKRFRQAIYEAWSHRCGYCGAEATSLDHIIPRFKSGSSNRKKMEEWYYKQDFFTQARMDNIQTWVSKEAIDLFVYQVNSLPLVI